MIQLWFVSSYVDMGGWVGGQAEYVMVPYAVSFQHFSFVNFSFFELWKNEIRLEDFNCLKFPDKKRAMEKILDLALLSDIFPTGTYISLLILYQIAVCIFIYFDCLF
jgi:threonine dehydrogenase-like Zn-dependent dehydrogenase